MELSRDECILKLNIFLLNFVLALENLSFNICLIVLLFVKSQNLFAVLLCLIEFLPGAFTVWHKYLSENRTWNKKFLFLWCHPVNVVVWPLMTIHNPNESNRTQLKVSIFNEAFLLITIKHVLKFSFKSCKNCFLTKALKKN
jgi:hypothetical protein